MTGSCPECHRPILRKSEDGSVRLRAKIVVFRGDRTIAVCRCGAEADVAITLEESFRKSLDVGKMLVIRRGKRA